MCWPCLPFMPCPLVANTIVCWSIIDSSSSSDGASHINRLYPHFTTFHDKDIEFVNIKQAFSK